MNMFSMKPKFDLAAFLAEPAPVGARRRGMRTKFGAAATADRKTDTPAAKAPVAKPDTK